MEPSSNAMYSPALAAAPPSALAASVPTPAIAALKGDVPNYPTPTTAYQQEHNQVTNPPTAFEGTPGALAIRAPEEISALAGADEAAAARALCSSEPSPTSEALSGENEDDEDDGKEGGMGAWRPNIIAESITA